MPVIPTGPQHPTFPRLIREQQRTERLRQKKPPPNENPAVDVREVVYSYAGHPVANDISGGYLIRDPEAILTGIFISARTAGSTASTLDVRINGSTVYTVTMAPGETMVAEDALNIECDEWDVASVVFTASGTGLATVVVQIGYQVITA